MFSTKERVKILAAKIKIEKLNTGFVGKVNIASRQVQLMDEMPYWQANNDKSPTDKPWGMR